MCIRDSIQFMHKLSNPNCEMGRCIMYNFNNYRNMERCIAETKKVTYYHLKVGLHSNPILKNWLTPDFIIPVLVINYHV